MKNMGVAGPDSSKEAAKSSALPTTYLLPNFSSIKSLRGAGGGNKRSMCIHQSQNDNI